VSAYRRVGVSANAEIVGEAARTTFGRRVEEWKIGRMNSCTQPSIDLHALGEVLYPCPKGTILLSPGFQPRGSPIKESALKGARDSRSLLPDVTLIERNTVLFQQ
jgi:hypothetical protein